MSQVLIVKDLQGWECGNFIYGSKETMLWLSIIESLSLDRMGLGNTEKEYKSPSQAEVF